MPSPYNADPPAAVVQNHADGIFYGWKGLLEDTAFKDNVSSVIQKGIYDAVVQLIDDNKIVDKQGAIFLMAWLAQAADQKSTYLKDSAPPTIVELKDFIQEITTIIDAP
jgi:hypothetical protein